jgi:hypothetical protein
MATHLTTIVFLYLKHHPADAQITDRNVSLKIIIIIIIIIIKYQYTNKNAL